MTGATTQRYNPALASETGRAIQPETKAIGQKSLNYADNLLASPPRGLLTGWFANAFSRATPAIAARSLCVMRCGISIALAALRCPRGLTSSSVAALERQPNRNG
jgi:hypothetical protein